MKVVHVLKKIETIDQDIKELRKLEKSVKGNKTFTTPIIMSIEKQINLLLGDRIKLLELKIDNPPESLISDKYNEDENYSETEGEKLSKEKEDEKPAAKRSSRVKIKEKSGKTAKSSKPSAKTKKAKNVPAPEPEEDTDDYDDVPMLTQDSIDEKISSLRKEEPAQPETSTKEQTEEDVQSSESDSDSIKLLDIALEKGNLEKKDQDKPKEKKIRFFRDNFPAD